jgi:hypothetical protein
MALFQAVTVLCRYMMNICRAMTYHDLIKQWVDGLHTHDETPMQAEHSCFLSPLQLSAKFWACHVVVVFSI